MPVKKKKFRARKRSSGLPLCLSILASHAMIFADDLPVRARRAMCKLVLVAGSKGDVCAYSGLVDRGREDRNAAIALVSRARGMSRESRDALEYREALESGAVDADAAGEGGKLLLTATNAFIIENVLKNIKNPREHVMKKALLIVIKNHVDHHPHIVSIMKTIKKRHRGFTGWGQYCLENHGTTPLHIIAMTPRFRMYLLEESRIVFTEEDARSTGTLACGSTPLHLARNPRFVRYLLNDLRADIEARDAEGNTPLMSMARHAPSSAILALLRGGANVDVHGNNDQDVTPLHIIAQRAWKRTRSGIRVARTMLESLDAAARERILVPKVARFFLEAGRVDI
jgi:hypothetical protein